MILIVASFHHCLMDDGRRQGSHRAKTIALLVTPRAAELSPLRLRASPEFTFSHLSHRTSHIAHRTSHISQHPGSHASSSVMHSLERVIIHFDYDAFYASVFEAKNPALKNVPFAVQQKQIIVTVNYKGRERGLHKLQLVKEARRVCPEVVIELGEDLSIFRDASVELFRFIRSFSWSDRAERLGFDEVWLDVTDMVEHNLDLLNRNDLRHSFFQLSRDDPTRGFAYDATSVAGHTYPEDYAAPADADDLTLRLRIGSHLALHIRYGHSQSARPCTSTTL